MKIITTKQELFNSLSEFKDTDKVTIEIHDMVLSEDLYQFYVDPIDMELDNNGNHRGHEIRLSILPNVKSWYEVIVEINEEEGTKTIKSFDNTYELFIWYATLPNESLIDGINVIKNNISVEYWIQRENEQAEKSHNII